MDSVSELNSEKKLRRLSRSFRFYKYAAIVVFVIFVVGGLFVFKDEITSENLRYLIKYLDLSNTDPGTGESTLTFDSSQSLSRGALFKNDLVMVGPNSIDVYDLFNGRIYSDTFIMSRPAFSVSSKHVLVYDIGGKDARLFNSFSSLWSATYDYPIFCADASDSGKFAVATSEKNYHSAVYVYDTAYDRIFKWLSADKYVSDVALSDQDDTSLAIAALRAEKGDFVSELLLFKVFEKDPVASWSFPGQMPLKTFTSAAASVLLTDRALHVIPEGSQPITVSFPTDKQLVIYGFFDDFYAVVLNDNTVGVNQRLMIAYPSGKYDSIDFNEEIIDLSANGKDLYLLMQNKIAVVNVSDLTVTEYPVEGEYTSLCVAGDRSVVLINSSGARLTQLKGAPGPSSADNINGGQ